MTRVRASGLILGLGHFLLASSIKNKEKYLTIAKNWGPVSIDVEWKEIYEKSQKLKVKDKPSVYDVEKGMECDIWLLSPRIVVEIKADEITRSPIHTRPSRTSFSPSAEISR